MTPVRICRRGHVVDDENSYWRLGERRICKMCHKIVRIRNKSMALKAKSPVPFYVLSPGGKSGGRYWRLPNGRLLEVFRP